MSPQPTTPDSARVAIVRELARRAALDFLRDRAADVALPGKGAALASRLVARAALAVGRRDLVLGARELLLSIEPNSENRLEFAAELARSGAAERASQVLLEAQADKRRPPPASTLADTQTLDRDGASRNRARSAADVSSRLERARGLATLGSGRRSARAARARDGASKTAARSRSCSGGGSDRRSVVPGSAAGCRRRGAVRSRLPRERRREARSRLARNCLADWRGTRRRSGRGV